MGRCERCGEKEEEPRIGLWDWERRRQRVGRRAGLSLRVPSPTTISPWDAGQSGVGSRTTTGTPILNAATGGEKQETGARSRPDREKGECEGGDQKN